MIEYNTREREFLKELEQARLSTSHNDIPHVKPVSFVLGKDSIIVATDYETKTYSNVKMNPKAAIAIDVYKSGGYKAVCIQGKVKIIEEGDEFKKLYNIFYEKFAWVRKDPWIEKEAPFLKIMPRNKVS